MTKPNDTKKKIKIVDLTKKVEHDNLDKVVGGTATLKEPSRGQATGRRQHRPL